jgi:hypothetical protein
MNKTNTQQQSRTPEKSINPDEDICTFAQYYITKNFSKGVAVSIPSLNIVIPGLSHRSTNTPRQCHQIKNESYAKVK